MVDVLVGDTLNGAEAGPAKALSFLSTDQPAGHYTVTIAGETAAPLTFALVLRQRTPFSAPRYRAGDANRIARSPT